MVTSSTQTLTLISSLMKNQWLVINRILWLVLKPRLCVGWKLGQASGDVPYCWALLPWSSQASRLWQGFLYKVFRWPKKVWMVARFSRSISRPGWLTIGPDLSNSNYDWGLHQVLLSFNQSLRYVFGRVTFLRGSLRDAQNGLSNWDQSPLHQRQVAGVVGTIPFPHQL